MSGQTIDSLALVSAVSTQMRGHRPSFLDNLASTFPPDQRANPHAQLSPDEKFEV